MQSCSGHLAGSGNKWGILYSFTKHNHQQKDDLIFSGRSFIKMRNRTGPKTDPLGTTDRTGTGSEA